MTARRSAACEDALRAVQTGVPPYRAALDAGVSPSTVYVAIKKIREGRAQWPPKRK